MAGYLDEFRVNARALAAAFVGLGTGFSLNNFSTSLILPYVMRDLGWDKASLAFVSSLGVLVLFFIPVVGRVADVLGVRRTAAVGVFSLPVTYILLSLMTGDLSQYVAIFCIQQTLCLCTTATVWSRLVAQRFSLARGLALAIFASAPALIGAAGSPGFDAFVAAHGWRAGYQALAGFSFVFGLVALALIPHVPPRAAPLARRRARDDYGEILRTRAFWVLFAALLLCNLPQVFLLSQMKIMLVDRGIGMADAALMMSGFAAGQIAGRFVCGFGVDRLPMHLVAAAAMALPSLGYFALAGGVGGFAPVAAAVFVCGLGFGAEGDLMSYIVSRLFRIEIFSSVLGLITAAVGCAAGIGAALLGVTLKTSGGYTLFLTLCGWTVLAGGLLFLLLRAPREARA